jgi:hypothetical protein
MYADAANYNERADETVFSRARAVDQADDLTALRAPFLFVWWLEADCFSGRSFAPARGKPAAMVQYVKMKKNVIGFKLALLKFQQTICNFLVVGLCRVRASS